MKHLTISKELKIANSLYANAKYKGGYSINWNLEQPSKGYLVSIQDGLEYPSLSDVNEHEVSQWIKDNKNQDCFFGSWLDKSSGKVYFDLSVITDDLNGAYYLAISKNQLAIFDLNNAKEIQIS